MRLSLGTSALSSITSLSSWRLRLVPLEVRMWRLYACPRLILPVPVFLKRLAAPLCVFSFGIVSFYYNINAQMPPAAALHRAGADNARVHVQSCSYYCGCCGGGGSGGAAGAAGAAGFSGFASFALPNPTSGEPP